ncbi:MAG: hypothetical protein ACREDJ_01735 [Methylocella sp.]
MRSIRKSLLAGAAMIVFAGCAQAQSPGTHVLTIPLPGGGVEQVRYSGRVAPEVSFGTNRALENAPLLFAAYAQESPFAILDRISAEMNQRAASLLQQAAAMMKQFPPDPNQQIQADFGSLPPNGRSYTFVSTMSASGFCGRSVEITSSGNGRQPRIVSRSFGHCGGAPRATAPGSVSAPSKPRHRTDTIMANAQSSQSGDAAPLDMVKEAAWQP